MACAQICKGLIGGVFLGSMGDLILKEEKYSGLRGLEADVKLDRLGVELITGNVNDVFVGSGNALGPNIHFYRKDTINCVRN